MLLGTFFTVKEKQGMLLKLAGAVLIIGTASLGGVHAADGLQNQYRQMQYLQRLMCRLKSEIWYARSYLGEAFRQIGISAEEPYQRWLTSMAAKMECKDGRTFAEIWEEQVKECLGDSGLPESAISHLKRLGTQLGNTDIDMQVKTLELYLKESEQFMEEMHGEMKTKIKLYHCLGVMSGIFVTIILI